MKKSMAGLILVLFAAALFMTGCEKKAQETEEDRRHQPDSW